MKKIQTIILELGFVAIFIFNIFADSNMALTQYQGDKHQSILYDNQIQTTKKVMYNKKSETKQSYLDWFENYKVSIEHNRELLTDDSYDTIMNMCNQIYDLISNGQYDKYYDIYLEIEEILNEEIYTGEGKVLETLDDYLEWTETYRIQLERIKHQLPKSTYNKILTMWSKMYELTSEEKHDESHQIYLEIEKILEEYSVNYGDQSFNMINVYKVSDGEIDFNLKRDEFNLHKALWDRVELVYPEKYLNKIKFFKIVVENDKQETLAAVAPLNKDRSKFELIITLISAFDEDGYMSREQLNNTLIHELGHIITLEGDQVDTKNNKQNNSLCIDDHIWFYSNTYMTNFYNTFWKEIDKVRLEALKYREVDKEKYDQMYNNYIEDYSVLFFSSYVMSTPIEDIAESFARFVLDEKPEGKSVLDRKKLFFYQYKELVEMRQYMREQIHKAGL